MASFLFPNTFGFGTLSVTLLLGLLVVALYFIFANRQPANLPPGPWCWPIIGALPSYFIGRLQGFDLMHEFLQQLASRYGKVCSMKMGRSLMVVLSDVDITRNAFGGNDFADRPAQGDGRQQTDLVFGSGAVWREQRKFFMSVFRGFGVGQSSFDKHVSNEAVAIVDHFKQYANQPFEPRRSLALASANVICGMLFGKRYNYDDEEFIRLYDLVKTILRLQISGGLRENIPLLKYLAQKENKQMVSCGRELRQILGAIIEEHKQRLEEKVDSEEEPEITDFIDAYILEMKGRNSEETAEYFTDKNLKENITNLFIAGIETTSNALGWAMLYMATHPDIQKRVQQEIDDVLGDRTVKNSDADDLPYVQATILELHRIRPVAPLGAPHFNSKEAIINGYTIPANTVVVANLWTIHQDSSVWDNPGEFRPGRFLKEESGTMVVYGQDRMIPFSIGRRICSGEKIAKVELFVIFTSLLQHFTITLPDDHRNDASVLRPQVAFGLVPNDIPICVQLRKNDDN